MTVASARTAFDGLFDDAAIFPPGNTPMKAARQQHAGYRRGARAALVGPFVCSLARLPELVEAVDEGEPIEVSVVVPPGPFTLESTARVRVVAIEKLVDAGEDVSGLPAAPVTYVEFPTLPQRPQQLAPLAAAGLRVKYRTGGLTAAAVPSAAALSAAICAAVQAGVAFKCTAGLHHAVRHTSAEGFEQHGFLNVLLAAHGATNGVHDVVGILSERDGAVLAAALRALPDADLARAREAFTSFGTCSIAEPVADLETLGLLG